MKCSAVIVWYNPSPTDIKNIASVATVLDRTIIVDNSSSNNNGLVPDKCACVYVPLYENRGIAAALNVGCQIAQKQGSDWVLTIDQDSSFDRHEIREFLKLEASVLTDESIAVVAASINTKAGPKYSEKDSVITSGNLLRLSAFEKVGGFNEMLFIDQVDHDFCFRLRRNGYRILVANNIKMNHVIGSPVTVNILGLTLSSSNHNVSRKYYITRNRLYVRDRFPDFPRPYFRMFVADVVKILLVERQKLRKLHAMISGIKDYFFGRFGKWDHC